MERIPFLMKIVDSNTHAAIAAVKALEGPFEKFCMLNAIKNFSVWHMGEYLFGYAECNGVAVETFDPVFAMLPDSVRLVCRPGTMRMMYHDLGIVREDKSLIRHRVFATRLHEGCEEEYKRRHDGLVSARGNTIKEGPESDFTIWYGDGCIFGYCELVKAFDDHIETAEEHAATVDWETKGLEIMDWITDDVDWLTGLKHPHVERVI